MPQSQPGIFADGERMARYIRFDLAADADFESALHLVRGLGIDESIVVGRSDYGGRKFACAVAKGSVFAVQFHPEKSQAAGKRLLDGFRAWVDQS